MKKIAGKGKREHQMTEIIIICYYIIIYFISSKNYKKTNLTDKLMCVLCCVSKLEKL